MIWPLTRGLFATVYPLANYLGILLLFNFSFNCDVFVVFQYHGYAGITEQSVNDSLLLYLMALWPESMVVISILQNLLRLILWSIIGYSCCSDLLYSCWSSVYIFCQLLEERFEISDNCGFIYFSLQFYQVLLSWIFETDIQDINIKNY